MLEAFEGGCKILFHYKPKKKQKCIHSVRDLSLLFTNDFTKKNHHDGFVLLSARSDIKNETVLELQIILGALVIL
ncbi:CLUMA_CG000397, isoform A [Clunio marinus]|uniref:CLUMA_CG000397, isoform A n=1 Tax=Clunio marinus TaxID=568069 RepID=A0A1J1HF88_9DIPT|nr:CLUMA_CG000397, isoform A [Clunio marinus]